MAIKQNQEGEQSVGGTGMTSTEGSDGSLSIFLGKGWEKRLKKSEKQRPASNSITVFQYKPGRLGHRQKTQELNNWRNTRDSQHESPAKILWKVRKSNGNNCRDELTSCDEQVVGRDERSPDSWRSQFCDVPVTPSCFEGETNSGRREEKSRMNELMIFIVLNEKISFVIIIFLIIKKKKKERKILVPSDEQKSIRDVMLRCKLCAFPRISRLKTLPSDSEVWSRTLSRITWKNFEEQLIKKFKTISQRRGNLLVLDPYLAFILIQRKERSRKTFVMWHDYYFLIFHKITHTNINPWFMKAE